MRVRPLRVCRAFHLLRQAIGSRGSRRKQVVRGARPLIDHRKHGLWWFKVLLEFDYPESAGGIASFCESPPEVFYRYTSMGLGRGNCGGGARI